MSSMKSNQVVAEEIFETRMLVVKHPFSLKITKMRPGTPIRSHSSKVLLLVPFHAARSVSSVVWME
jgi:hypothetical protein